MQFRPASDEERAWWRIVASLLVFAGLAERAAYSSPPVRWLVLSILRLAHSVVADLVLDAAGLPPEAYEDSRDDPCGHSPEDALAFAVRFMTLAAMLAGLIRETNWQDRWPAPRLRDSRPLAPRRLTDGWARQPYDTS